MVNQTTRWLRDMVLNPPLVWENPDGTVAEVENVTRFGSMSRWDLRPMWMHTFLTTRAKCGCRHRLGIWRTIWCARHAFEGEDQNPFEESEK